MAFLYTDEQIAIGEEARRQLAARYDSGLLHRLIEARGEYDQDLWRLCACNGWTGVTIDPAHGGLGLGLIELCLVTEALGRVAAGAPFLSTSFACADTIARHGDDAVQRRWLPALAAGEAIGVLATTEGVEIAPGRPGTRVAGGRLSGRKAAVTGAAAAGVAVVYAAADDAGGEPGLFAVDLAGVGREVLDSFDNSRCAADLVFDGQPAHRLGGGHAALMMALSRLAVVVAAEQTGGADACVELARDYANTRVAFGQPIGKFQSVKHGITEMWVLAQLARSAAADAAHRFDNGDPGAGLAAATARLNASEAYEKAAWLAVQVHGGMGVTWDADLHLHYRRARAMGLELGRPSLWEDRIVAALEQAA